jgi:para-aminobenzoate synthetase component 1
MFAVHTLTSTVSLDEVPYRRDSCELFEHIRKLPGAAFFDSAFPYSSNGRYDILTACPLDAGLPTLPTQATTAESLSFFDELSRFQADSFSAIQPVSQDIPFCGGILGYLDYDAGSSLNRLPAHRASSASELSNSTSHLQVYEWAVIQDHLLGKAVLVALPSVSASRRRELLLMLRDSAVPSRASFQLTDLFESNFTADEYAQAYQKIKDYIRAGDCYQVNLAQRFTARFEGDPWCAYKLLRRVASAPFSAFIAQGESDAVMSLSPERFIALHGQHVEASPIKGTRPRHDNSEDDLRAANELKSSEKDRAENLMIVDLLRNDLGRSCVPGSIHVDRLFELQSFPTVHHLVSTISGELMPERGAWELLRDSFPGGSITGAPKRRAMEIITQLEPHARQVYCGSMLYISADGRMDSNIAIRTLLCQAKQIHCWGGGGIVADSQCEQEYQETYDKVGKLLDVLEGMRQ